MSTFEVPNPVLSSPFEEPKERWWILESQPWVKTVDPRSNELLVVKKLEGAK